MTRRAAGRRRARTTRMRPEPRRTRGLAEPANVDVLTRAVAAADASAGGLEACVRHARSETVRVLAEALLPDAIDLAAGVRAMASRLGVALPGVPRRSTCERLRWDWIASTGALLDGVPDVRLGAECALLLERLEQALALALRSVHDDGVGEVLGALRVRTEGARLRLESAVIECRTRADLDRTGLFASS